MKTKLVLTVILTSFIFLTGCSNDSIEEPVALSKRSSKSNGSSAINQTYPQAQAEVLATFMAIRETIIINSGTGLKNMDELIAFHEYERYTFTEFNYNNNGVGHSYTAEENEQNERTLFGTIVDEDGVRKFAAVDETLKIAVYYGNVANLTFVSDFELLIGGNLLKVNNLITLLFVKTKGEWKLVHEHHSPLKIDPSSGTETGSYPLQPADLSSHAQQEVLKTFMAIGGTILENSGTGRDNMDELISFHAYGPKFTEFNYDGDGNGHSFDSGDNATNERNFFGDNKVTKFAYKENTLNIAVYYGNVANVTFVSDFEVEGIGTINNLITLLFVKTKGEWKLVHEHHSPENLPILP